MEHFIFRMMRDLILMIFLVNLLGLYFGNIFFSARETFVEGGLHPHSFLAPRPLGKSLETKGIRTT